LLCAEVGGGEEKTGCGEGKRNKNGLHTPTASPSCRRRKHPACGAAAVARSHPTTRGSRNRGLTDPRMHLLDLRAADSIGSARQQDDRWRGRDIVCSLRHNRGQIYEGRWQGGEAAVGIEIVGGERATTRVVWTRRWRGEGASVWKRGGAGGEARGQRRRRDFKAGAAVRGKGLSG
jgi:hypothetical protein